MSQPESLSDKQADVTLAVAEDKLSDEAIAEKFNITRRTLARWKRLPLFATRVEEHRTAWREQVKAEGIANKQNRIDRLNQRAGLLDQVIAARAEANQKRNLLVDGRPKREDAEDATAHLAAVVAHEKQIDFDDYAAAGAETGLMVHTVTYLKDGRREEWAVDTGLLKELREHEKQAAQELRQWSDGATSVLSKHINLDTLTDDQLERLANGDDIIQILLGR